MGAASDVSKMTASSRTYQHLHTRYRETVCDDQSDPIDQGSISSIPFGSTGELGEITKKDRKDRSDIYIDTYLYTGTLVRKAKDRGSILSYISESGGGGVVVLKMSDWIDPVRIYKDDSSIECASYDLHTKMWA